MVSKKPIEPFRDALYQGLAKAGFGPHNCEGWRWFDEVIAKFPNISISSAAALVNQKIQNGEAVDGWLKSALRYARHEMSEEDRILFIQYLAKKGAHKSLLNSSLYSEMTDRELNVFENLLRGTKQLKAASRIMRRRVERAKLKEVERA